MTADYALHPDPDGDHFEVAAALGISRGSAYLDEGISRDQHRCAQAW